MIHQQLKIYNRQTVLSFTNIRKFETKIGEVVQTLPGSDDVEQALQQSKAKFVIVGVPEDIGIKANGAIGGTVSAWNSFLQSFLNIQSNDFFDGSDVLLLGHLNFAGAAEVIESNAGNANERIEAYRHSVTAIDDAVEAIVKTITSFRKVPVIISGGTANTYGCIKGAAKGWHKAGALQLAQINVINVDAHAGYKPMEGRHSGNAIRYAEEDGYLEKYCVVGLHENELPQNAWLDIANNPFYDFVTYEDIFIHGKQSFADAVHHAISFTSDALCGVEMNLESIQNGSISPVGISLLQARQFLHLSATHSQPAYLHVAEPFERSGGNYNAEAYGKMISYLVSDFIKVIGY
ncbi:MAG: arginase family protein [Bacteroidota bacterium]|nr:arginase family protein [Bacteroidota bacterium]